MNKKYLALVVFVFAYLFFSFHIFNVKEYYFDEFHYVKAAKDWLNLIPVTNLEHPPLGKILIAVGIKLFGDNPLGYRFASLFFGALSISTIFLISEIIFSDILIAALISLLGIFNFWFYIHARIGMLDIFLISFFLLSIFCYLKFEFSRNKMFFWLSSVFWGLTVGIKWSGVFLYFPFIIHIFYNEIKNKNYIGMKKIFLFGILSIFIYFLTFTPYLITKGGYRYDVYDLVFKLPKSMLELQKSVPADHPYMSNWYSWPLMLRPIWYEFKQYDHNQFFRGIILLGNPFYMLIGILAIIHLLVRFLHLDKLTKSLLFIFLFSWIVWGVLPRKVTFFYYYFPSVTLYLFFIPLSLKEYLNKKQMQMVLSGFVLISIFYFIYFYPVISGVYTPESLRMQWYWIQSWI